jgi:uncharacterized protein
MARPVRARVDGLDWATATADLDEVGAASLGPVLTADECAALRDAFDDDARYRSTIDMTRYRFGSGTYRYFAYPLPEPLDALRRSLWPHLLPIARTWADRRELVASWPDEFDAWIDQCHAHGQTRPTPLILRYGPGDWNALHRDLYGELVFPLQVVIGLDAPGVDYTGGEFVVVEQRPRAQSRATVMQIPQGHGVVFTTRDRPARTQRGWSNTPMRHGLSVVRSGRRHALGIVFHDAA